MWTLIGTRALVARLWVYHRVYDDVLAFLAVIAVARIALSYPGMRRGRAATASHLAAQLITLVAPCWWGLNETAEINAGRAAIPRPR